MFEGLIDILNQAFQSFGLLLINLFFAMFNGMISLTLTPIITLINDVLIIYDVNYINDLTSIITNFTTLINTVIIPNALWVINLFPPITFNVCLMFIGLWFLILSYEISIRVIIRILSFFKKVIPFF